MTQMRPEITDSIPSITSRRLWIGLGLFMCALAIRLYRLDAQSLWLDEGGTWAEVTGRTGKGWLLLIAELFSPNAGYPLYHLLLKAWVTLAGQSEWALRFPSALAGAAAVVAVYLAAGELSGAQQRFTAALTSLLVAVSPFAIWHSQDAKVYSLLFLIVALETWALLRALRRNDRPAWMLVLALLVMSLFIHRLALLAAAGIVLTWAFTRATLRRWLFVALAGGLGAAGVAGTILAARGERDVSGAPVGPLEGLGLTFARFSLDRWPGDLAGFLGLPALVWLLPFVLLVALGLVELVRDARKRYAPAIAILCMFVVPLGLFGLTLVFAPIYQPRYAMVAFPGWLLTIVYPFTKQETNRFSRWGAILPWSCALVALLAGMACLFQPVKGIFSGDPVKEQWREAVTYLAHEVQPDDLVIIHPYYVAPLYNYYALRVTPDPLPQPVTFNLFAEGFFEQNNSQQVRQAVRRYYEPYFNEQARGKKRMLLLIAPDHARTVDPPKSLEELIAEALPGSRPEQPDMYGWLGLRFLYPQHTWPCGGSGNALIGVEVMCQSFPETYNSGGPGTIPEPEIRSDARFGDVLRLRGFTIHPHGGMLRPGGTLPITLYWEALQPPPRDYTMFVHFCRDCTIPPLAGNDRPPLAGYGDAGRTTTWRVADPVHDERTVVLPKNLPPGNYTVVLGVYPAGDPAISARLQVTGSTNVLDGNRLVLTEVVVGER